MHTKLLRKNYIVTNANLILNNLIQILFYSNIQEWVEKYKFAYRNGVRWLNRRTQHKLILRQSMSKCQKLAPVEFQLKHCIFSVFRSN